MTLFISNLNISTKGDTFFYINFSIITDRIFISKLIPSVESTVKDWASLMCRPWKWRRGCYVSNTGMSLLHETARVCLFLFFTDRLLTKLVSLFKWQTYTWSQSNFYIWMPGDNKKFCFNHHTEQFGCQKVRFVKFSPRRKLKRRCF